MRVYLAGPLFNEAERTYAKKIVDKLESKGITTYWPWRDAGDAKLKQLHRGRKLNSSIVMALLFILVHTYCSFHLSNHYNEFRQLYL